MSGGILVDQLQEAGRRRRSIALDCQRRRLYQRGAARSRRHARSASRSPRKVKVNSMTAGERLFVDLLPENWTGVPPGLPQEVVDELARARARPNASARQQRAGRAAEDAAAVRVRVAQPADLHALRVRNAGHRSDVVAERGDGQAHADVSTSRCKFDLADAKAALPPTLEAIDSRCRRRFRRRSMFDSQRQGRRAHVPRGSQHTSSISVVDGAERQAGGRAGWRRKSSRAGDRGAGNSRPACSRAGSRRRSPRREPPPQSCRASRRRQPSRAAMPPRRAAAPPPPSREDAAVPPCRRAAGRAGRAAGRRAERAEPAKSAASAATQPAPNPDATVGDRGASRQGDNLRADLPVRGADAGGGVPPRRHAVAGVRQRGHDRSRRAHGRYPAALIRSAAVERAPDGAGRADQARAAAADQRSTPTARAGSVTIGDTMPSRRSRSASRAASSARAAPASPSRSTSRARLHRLDDPDIGDTLLVVTALGPARGFLKAAGLRRIPRAASTHGVVVQPIADDVTVELAPDKIIDRPAGRADAVGRRRVGQQQRRPLPRRDLRPAALGLRPPGRIHATASPS